MEGRESHYRYPWHHHNKIDILVDGVLYFPAMLQAISNARSYVLLEMYLFESGQVATHFIDAFTHAARRGVQVYLLLDDFGARKLQAIDRQQLIQSGAQLAFYNPLRYGELRRNLFRDHRKLLIIDGHQVFTGGTGIADEFDATKQRPAWHDVMLRVQGGVVADWQALFLSGWNRLASTPLQFPATESGLAHDGDLCARLTINAPSRMELKRSLLRQFNLAEQRLWIATAYFIPSWKIRRRLRKAVMRGVDVRLLLPGKHTDHPSVRHAGRRYYTKLLRDGVRIYEYQPRFLHAKILLCDTWVSIGSSNIDRWNMRWNLEANQEVEDAEFARQITELFEHDFEQSKEINYESWQQRPWHRHLRERFWGWVAQWLERLGQK